MRGFHGQLCLPVGRPPCMPSLLFEFISCAPQTPLSASWIKPSLCSRPHPTGPVPSSRTNTGFSYLHLAHAHELSPLHPDTPTMLTPPHPVSVSPLAQPTQPCIPLDSSKPPPACRPSPTLSPRPVRVQTWPPVENPADMFPCVRQNPGSTSLVLDPTATPVTSSPSACSSITHALQGICPGLAQPNKSGTRKGGCPRRPQSAALAWAVRMQGRMHRGPSGVAGSRGARPRGQGGLSGAVSGLHGSVQHMPARSGRGLRPRKLSFTFSQKKNRAPRPRGPAPAAGVGECRRRSALPRAGQGLKISPSVQRTEPPPMCSRVSMGAWCSSATWRRSSLRWSGVNAL